MVQVQFNGSLMFFEFLLSLSLSTVLLLLLLLPSRRVVVPYQKKVIQLQSLTDRTNPFNPTFNPSLPSFPSFHFHFVS